MIPYWRQVSDPCNISLRKSYYWLQLCHSEAYVEISQVYVKEVLVE
jgi:hypothetical protein